MFCAIDINSILNWINDNIVWGIPLMALILIVGAVLTIKLKGIGFSKVGQALKVMVKNEEGGTGEVSTFGALCISMAATLGTGKIIGVATAIQLGGPGALFWMIVAAILGMSTKYAEGFLAIKYRKKQKDGTVIGGPFAYIEGGLNSKLKWLAKAFAIFGACAGVMGIGTMTQMNSINDSIVQVFDPNNTNVINIFGTDVSVLAIIITAVVTVLAAIAVIGGIQRISKVSTILVPFMAAGYFLVCLAVVLFNITAVPAALLEIIKSAFSFKAGAGAVAGYGIMLAMRQGISKGIFSNEAGLGSTPIAIASAKSDNPVEQGLACMGTTFIDTMVLCLIIGLGIVITGTYKDPSVEGINITITAFAEGLNIM